jgi:hypothetical protein
LGLSRVKALHCFSCRELREVIVDTPRTSREKSLNYSFKEHCEVIIKISAQSPKGEKRELAEVLSTQPVQ